VLAEPRGQIRQAGLLVICATVTLRKRPSLIAISVVVTGAPATTRAPEEVACKRLLIVSRS
jgi:hypothetical protein